ncbi:2-oxoacid:acceptor oxidoreductase family protein [Thermodesulfobacteriota bacterium]
MIEIVFFGRGGQGAVTAAEVLATAASLEGKYAQAFPSFSGERRGAPVFAYARIDEHRIVDRGRIIKTDYLLLLDPNLLKTSNPLNDLKKNGTAILNLDRSPEDLIKKAGNPEIEVYCIDALAISEEIYGQKPIPITNIAMLGAFSSVSGAVQLDNIILAVDNFFSGKQAEEAKQTARMAFTKMEGAKNS